MTNATLLKYQRRTKIEQEGETVTIIGVAEHKTGLFGRAKLITQPIQQQEPQPDKTELVYDLACSQ